MLAVGATEEEVISSLAVYTGRAEIAVVNVDRAVVLSGNQGAVAENGESLVRQKCKVTRLPRPWY